jgi:adenylate kinase
MKYSHNYYGFEKKIIVTKRDKIRNHVIRKYRKVQKLARLSIQYMHVAHG